MPDAAEFVSFSLKNGRSVSDFLIIPDRLKLEFLIKQKGYISRKLLAGGEKWTDFVLWEAKEQYYSPDGDYNQ